MLVSKRQSPGPQRPQEARTQGARGNTLVLAAFWGLEPGWAAVLDTVMEEGRARSEEIDILSQYYMNLWLQMLAFLRASQLRFLISCIPNARYKFSGLFNNSGLLFGIFLKVPATAGILNCSPLRVAFTLHSAHA